MIKKPIQISASILSADFTKLGDEIKKCEDAGVDRLHIDVMDGHFVPPISMGEPILEAVRAKTKLPLEVHLMVDNPSFQIERFINAGADIIFIHAECYGERRAFCRLPGQFPKEVDTIDTVKILQDISRIKKLGKQAFVVLNPGTPMCLENILNEIDGVLIMSVNPGFSKQKFMPEVLSKVEALRKIFTKDISIDGGLNAETSPLAVKAGVNVISTASYFFGAPDPKSVVRYLKAL